MTTFQKTFNQTVALLLLSASSLAAQSSVVTGFVTDENGVGMGGVNVLVDGTSRGTATDAAGNFSLAIPHDSTQLTFQFVGYNTIQKTVGSTSVLHIAMEPSSILLSELMVVGYGVQERKDVTGAVASVDGKALNATPASNIENNFQGRLAGVSVISSGEPGATAQVIIRGASTFAGTSQPLYVVDGVPTLDISTVNTHDVESIVALKDAGAASIYGSRAANGVILITTKKGNAGKLTLTYSGSVGVQLRGKGMTNLLDSQGHAELTWLAQKNSGIANPSSPLYGNGASPVIPDYYNPPGGMVGSVDESTYDEITNPITRTNPQGTNWYREITQHAPIQNHDLAVSGGSATSRYYVGLNYFNQQGIVVYTGAKRYSMRINTEFTLRRGVRVGENFTTMYRSTSLLSRRINANLLSSILDCYLTPVVLPVYDVAGNFAYPFNASPTPYATQWRSKDNHSFSVRTLGNVYAEVDFLKAFTFRTSVGGSFQYGRSTVFTPKIATVANSFTEKSFDDADWNWQNTLTFKKNYGVHMVTVLAGTEALKTDLGRGIEGTRIGYYSEDPDFWSLGSGDANNQTNNGYAKTPASLLSFFSRIDYSFHNRYLLSATVRRDGSSKFINHKYGTFPSLTVAWRISEESFLKTVAFVNDLKLRAGYGVMGDQMNASATNSYTTFISNPGLSYYDISGSNSSAAIGYANALTGNPDGQWQVNKTANVGLDFSLFSGKWSGTIDVYKKVTEKLLYQSELPGTNGMAASAARNVGGMENKGIDLMLRYQTNVGRHWNINSTLTFTSYANRVTKVSTNVPYFYPIDFVRIEAGHPVGSFYGLIMDGLWQSQAEIEQANASDGDASTPFQRDAAPGRFRYRDENGDGKIDIGNDRTFIGNPNPNFSMGLNIGVTYRNFDVTAFLYGVQGNAFYSFTRSATDFYWSINSAKSVDLLTKSWTPERRNTTMPMAETIENFSNNQNGSYYVEDGSYLRFKNIQLGYSLPKSVLQKASLGMARIYVQAVNPFTFTKYKGLDPEVGGTAVAFGLAGGNYPQAQQLIVGLNLEF